MSVSAMLRMQWAALQIPLNIAIRETSDAGAPIVASDPSSAGAQAYKAIAHRLKQKLFDTEAAGQQEMPKIVTESLDCQ